MLFEYLHPVSNIKSIFLTSNIYFVQNLWYIYFYHVVVTLLIVVH
jgi:hypothetical protein